MKKEFRSRVEMKKQNNTFLMTLEDLRRHNPSYLGYFHLLITTSCITRSVILLVQLLLDP